MVMVMMTMIIIIIIIIVHLTALSTSSLLSPLPFKFLKPANLKKKKAMIFRKSRRT